MKAGGACLCGLPRDASDLSLAVDGKILLQRAGHDDARDDHGRAAVAVFMGVFLAITELTAQLLRGVEGGRPASELALART